MRNFLINTLVTTWDEPPRARHQVANELKLEGKVYFIEKNKIGFPRLEIKEVEENVIIITPFFYIDYRIKYRTPVLNEYYNRWLFNKLKKLSISFDMVFSFDYTSSIICQFYKDVIFYCADDHVGLGNFNPWFIKSYHTKTEKAVALKSKICIVTSEYMLSKIIKYNTCTYLVPLGAPNVINQNIFKISTRIEPVLGLVGYLDSNMDYTVLHLLLKRFTINFIGPVSQKIQKQFLHYKRANFLGVKTGEDLYNCLKEIDVCIAPYDLNKINKGLTPNKLWLYLAIGKPVVVTNIPNIVNWKFEEKLIYKCNNDEFIETCIAAHLDNNYSLTNKRIEVAKNNSWKIRVEEIKELYEKNIISRLVKQDDRN